MTFQEVELGDKVARMIQGKPLVLGTVVGKDQHGPPRQGPTLHVQVENGQSVTVIEKEFKEWSVMRG